MVLIFIRPYDRGAILALAWQNALFSISLPSEHANSRPLVPFNDNMVC